MDKKLNESHKNLILTKINKHTVHLRVKQYGPMPYCILCLSVLQYRKRGKIRWAKHSWFQFYEVFCGNTFAVHWPPVFITYLKLKIHRKTFAVSSKTAKV